MPDALIPFLIALFAIHFVIFLYLTIKNRKTQHIFVTLTFALLVLSFSCRLLMPEIEIFGHKLHTVLRIFAWISTVIVLSLVVKGRMARRTAAVPSPAVLGTDERNI